MISAVQVGGQDIIPVIRLHRQQKLVADDTGVVYENVNPTEGFENRLNGGLDLGHVGAVRLDGQALPSQGPKGLDSGLSRNGIGPVCESDPGTFGGSQLNTRATDSSGAAGYQNRLPLQSSHNPSKFSVLPPSWRKMLGQIVTKTFQPFKRKISLAGPGPF
jgi:hypothetical protein